MPLSIFWVWPVSRIGKVEPSRGYSLPMILEQSYVVERVNIEHIVLSEKRRSSMRFVDFRIYAEVRTDLKVEREFEIVEQFVHIVSQ
jgi:hypothetical protein